MAGLLRLYESFDSRFAEFVHEVGHAVIAKPGLRYHAGGQASPRTSQDCSAQCRLELGIWSRGTATFFFLQFS
ncbi:hypothetical protein D3C83_233180 [compost metagenome]